MVKVALGPSSSVLYDQHLNRRPASPAPSFLLRAAIVANVSAEHLAGLTHQSPTLAKRGQQINARAEVWFSHSTAIENML